MKNTLRNLFVGTLLATGLVGVPASASAANSPTRVEMYEKGQLKLVLGKSEPGSLNGRGGVSGGKYDGRAEKVRIHGEAGSIVAFFDDQKFRTGENFVIIRKTTDDPITVQIAKNFVEDAKEAGNGIYKGTGNGFEWVLMKNVKKDFFTRYKINELLGSGFVPKGDKLLKGLQLAPAGETTSANYRVDNCSSVRFGD